MAKNKVSEWSTTAANNTDIGGINIAEGCAPSGINNAIRELMAQVKDMQTGSDSDGFVVSGTMTCSGAAIMSSTLVVSGAATFSSNVIMSANIVTLDTGAKIRLDDSITTATSPSLTFDGDTNTGIYRPAADNFSIATNGIETVRFTSDGNMVLGAGEATTTVAGNILRAPDAAGTNLPGTNITVQPGNGTGTGGSGAVILKTASAGGSGTTANTMTQRLRVTPNGGISFGSTSTNYGSSGQVVKSAGDAPPTFGSVLNPKTAWVYSTNVTEITFTDIPTWAKRITIAVSQLSSNSTGQILLQIGYGSTYENSGYIGSVTNQAGTQETMSTGFKIVNSNTAASLYSGIIVLVNLDGNTWCEQATLGLTAGGTRESAGVKQLSSSLTSLRFYVDGTQLFDGGSINVLYE